MCVPDVVKGLGTLEVFFWSRFRRWNTVRKWFSVDRKRCQTRGFSAFFKSEGGHLQVQNFFPAQKGWVWEGFFFGVLKKQSNGKAGKDWGAKANGWIEKRSLPPLQIFCCDEHFWVHPRNLTYIMTPKWWFAYGWVSMSNFGDVIKKYLIS